jgi:hypothetical protein
VKLHEPRGWLFQATPQGIEEPCRRRPIQDAVIERKAQGHPFPWDDPLVVGGGLAHAAAHPEHRTLRQVENRREGIDAEATQVRNREGGVAHLLGGQ